MGHSFNGEYVDVITPVTVFGKGRNEWTCARIKVNCIVNYTFAN